MRTLIVANIEQLETVEFLTMVLYGTDGQPLTNMVNPYEGPAQIVKRAHQLLSSYDLKNCELYTSDERIYAAVLPEALIVGRMRHRSETNEASRAVFDHRELLIELHEIPLLVPPPEQPKWKRALIYLLSKAL